MTKTLRTIPDGYARISNRIFLPSLAKTIFHSSYMTSGEILGSEGILQGIIKSPAPLQRNLLWHLKPNTE